MLRVITIVCAVAFFVPAPALANRWSGSDVQTAISVADNYWPNSPCYGAHVIAWLDSDEWDAAGFGALAVGEGDLGGCHVSILWERVGDAGNLCAILAHEFGHNAGMDHSPDPTNVMYPNTEETPTCRAALPASTVVAHIGLRCRTIWHGSKRHHRLKRTHRWSEVVCNG